MELKTPLTFNHVYSSAPWGGGWIRTLFGRTDAPDICSESWEISGHPFGMSLMKTGPYAGCSLADLTKKFGVALVGTKAPDPGRFPLLIKLLDARRSLSVQVHPSTTNAALTGGEPKTEAWIVLAAAPGATLYAGAEPGTTEESFRAAAAHGEAMVGTLARHSVKDGDALYIPGGVVHAIGAGCLVYEVQQSSNTTYRFYDWDRVDALGNRRPLHIEQAFKSLDLGFPPVHLHRARDPEAQGNNIWRTYVHSPFFTIRELELKDEVEIKMDGSTFISFFVLEGGVKITSGGESVEAMRGASALVPAAAESCRLKARISATKLLVTTL